MRCRPSSIRDSDHADLVAGERGRSAIADLDAVWATMVVPPPVTTLLSMTPVAAGPISTMPPFETVPPCWTRK